MYWIVVISIFIPLVVLSLNSDLKKVNFIGIMILILLLVLFGFNNGNQDYQPYLELFNAPDEYAEIGYVYLVNFIKLIGGQHATLVLVVGVFYFITLLRALLVFKGNVSVFFLIYFIYPFIFDITQIRNTIMFGFVLNALIFIYESKWKLGWFCLLLGVLFHNFGVVYFLVFLIYRVYGENLRKIIILGLFFLFFLPLFFTYILPYVSIGRFNSLAESYISSDLKIRSLFIWGGDILFFIIIAQFLRSHILSRKNSINVNYNRLDFLFKIILIHLIFLGFVLNFFEFNRVYRNVFLIRYLYLCICIPLVSINWRVFILIYMFINAVIFSFLTSTSLSGSYDFWQILTSNHIFDLF